MYTHEGVTIQWGYFNLLFFYNLVVITMLLQGCLVIDHRWHQNVRGKNKTWHTNSQASVLLMFLPHFDIICNKQSITEQMHRNMESTC